MQTTRFPGRPDWTAKRLYGFVERIFPEHRTKLGILDIYRLSAELSKSHEAVYRWFRQGRLTPGNASALRDLAARLPNAEALRGTGREPPTIEEFLPFIVAD